MPQAIIYLPPSSVAYDAALEGLTALNQQVMMGDGVSGAVPPLYQSGARYKTEPYEMWRHAGIVAAEGWGDCEDLACYRAAECRVTGEDPGAYVRTYKTGPRRLHAIVQHSDGGVEDPSIILGMQPAHPAARIVDDPLAGHDDVTWDCDVSGAVVVRVPMAGGRAMMVRSHVPRRRHAPRRDIAGGSDVLGFSIRRALSATRAILSTPEAQALLPPGARLALQHGAAVARAARNVANAAARGYGRPAPQAPPPEEQAPPEEQPPTDDLPPADASPTGEPPDMAMEG